MYVVKVDVQPLPLRIEARSFAFNAEGDLEFYGHDDYEPVAVFRHWEHFMKVAEDANAESSA